MSHTLALLLTRYRLAGLLISLAVTMALAAGLPRVGFDTRIGVLLGDNDPYLIERDWLESQFPVTQEISIAVIAATGPTNVFSADILDALGAMHLQYRRIPYVERSSSVVAYDSPFGEIGLIPGRFRNFDEVSEQVMTAARQRAMAEDFINGTLVAPEADLALFSIRLQLQQSTTAQNREINEALDQWIAELRIAHPRVLFYPSAEAVFEQSTRQAMIQDLTRLLPLVILCCIVFICYCFRSVRYGASILLITLLTVTCTVGTLSWAGVSFNSISVMAPLVVVILAVANTAHILSVYRQHLAPGNDPSEAMRISLAFNARPVTLAALTTAIGFASLNYASAPAISQFGSVVALGVFYAWILSFICFPALILMTPPQAGEVRLAEGFLRWCRRLLHKHEPRVFWGVIGAGVLAAALLPLNETDFNRLDFIDKDSSLHRYYELVSERMGRGTGMSYGVVAWQDGSQQEDGAIEPEFLQAVDRFSDWLRQRDDILDVASLVEVVKTINDSLRGAASDTREPVNHYRLPDSKAEIEEHLMNYLGVQRSRYALDNFINDDFSTIRLFINTRPLSNQEIIDLDVAIGEYFRQHFSDENMRLLHGSNTLLFARMDKTVTIELIHSYLISLLTITLALTIGLRSVYFGLLSVIPNLLPATLIFGLWGLLVGTIDPFVMMLFSISIGLVVDDTVHMLSTYQRHQQLGCTPDEAIEAAISKAGPALTVTTAVLALGTFILLFASTLYFQQAAKLLVPIVVLALVLDLTFLPALLRRLERFRASGLSARAR
jgi:uncharacterized protein